MKTKNIAVVAALGLLPLSGFAQSPPPPPSNPPNQPVPPLPPIPPIPPEDHDHMPKEPTTFLGVETSQVPRVVSEQLGLPKGFGLVVDYVVPDGPAAAAGVLPSDIIKMLNDQILLEPSQLAKLVRSYAEGTSVTLTILRKGAEQKVTVKLAKRAMPAHHELLGPGNGPHHGMDFGQMNGELDKLRNEFQNLHMGPAIRNAVRGARREALRAADEARRVSRQLNIVSTDNGAVKSTKIDLGKAQIVFADEQGEMKIETVDGKKVLTAKDAQGRLLFSGPVGTKEELDKLPAEVRQRYDKLEQKDLPAANTTKAGEVDNGFDFDMDFDDDSDDSDTPGAAPTAVQGVSTENFSRSIWTRRGIWT